MNNTITINGYRVTFRQWPTTFAGIRVSVDGWHIGTAHTRMAACRMACAYVANPDAYIDRYAFNASGTVRPDAIIGRRA